MSDIDREVAEKVMGWRYVDDADEMDRLERVDRHQMPPGKLHRKGAWFVGDQRKACVECGDLPEFSTRIEHAWDVVEKLRHIQPAASQDYLTWPFELIWRADGDERAWFAQFLRPNGHPAEEGEADTAPLAICRAALEAVKDKT